MNRRQIGTLLVTFAVLASVVAPSVAGATASGDLQVDVEQDPATGDAAVTVTQNETAVANATVNVSGDAYAGSGTYETDANGTVALPNPNETVQVTLEVASGNHSNSTNVELVPLSDSLAVDVTQAADGGATVTVSQYGDVAANATVNVSGDAYAGNGTYETASDGTVSLSEPDGTVNVTVAATHDGLAAETDATLHESTLALDVSQGENGTVTVSVTRDGSAVSNASVDVAVSGNGSYAGTGSYETDENGTVTLQAPDRDVTVDVTASEGNDSVSETATLAGTKAAGELAIGVSQGADRVTISVTRDGESVDAGTVSVETDEQSALEGTYEIDDGSVVLEAPNDSVTATITAETDDAISTRSVELQGSEGEGPGFTPFGKFVSSFVDSVLNDEDIDGGIGEYVSEMVRSNNPGNADDERERPGAAANDGDERGPPSNVSSERGPAGDEGDDERGPPERVENDSDDDRRGPPSDDRRGPPEDRDDAQDADEADDDAEADDDEADGDEADGDDAESEDAEDERDDDDRGAGAGNGPSESPGRSP